MTPIGLFELSGRIGLLVFGFLSIWIGVWCMLIEVKLPQHKRLSTINTWSRRERLQGLIFIAGFGIAMMVVAVKVPSEQFTSTDAGLLAGCSSPFWIACGVGWVRYFIIELRRAAHLRQQQSAEQAAIAVASILDMAESPSSPALIMPRTTPAPFPAEKAILAEPAIPTDLFVSPMAQLGFVELVINGASVIIPPVCNVPAGDFLMGSDPKQDAEAPNPEKPQHPMVLPDYQIARFPVTVAEYACFIRATGRAAPTTDGFVDWGTQLQRLDHPVVCVTWDDALAYAAWLAQQTGEPWRLPTEVEWEKAARWDLATHKAYIYPWGDTFDATRCNVSATDIAAHLGTTTSVGTYPNGASPSGAQDMVGNVYEWTSSPFVSYPASNPWERLDRLLHPGRYKYDYIPRNLQADSASNLVVRGASFYDRPRLARSAHRFAAWSLVTPGDPTPVCRGADGGFRLVRASS